MIPQALVQQVLSDRAECMSHNETYQLILFVNLGTTLIGGRDDLIEIGKQLAEIEAVPSYIHLDGALDLGFFVNGIRLGPPGASRTTDGIPIVQGITLSHHKLFGIMVSGEIIGYCPNLEHLDTVAGSIEPRAVFETWLFEQIYLKDDLVSIWQYCLKTHLYYAGFSKISTYEYASMKIVSSLCWNARRHGLSKNSSLPLKVTGSILSPCHIFHSRLFIALLAQWPS